MQNQTGVDVSIPRESIPAPQQAGRLIHSSSDERARALQVAAAVLAYHPAAPNSNAKSSKVKRGAMKSFWSEHEDAAVLHWLQRTYGSIEVGPSQVNWQACAAVVCSRTRTYKQVRDRDTLGNRWKDIASNLPGRTELMVRNAFYAAKRRAERRARKLFGSMSYATDVQIKEEAMATARYDTSGRETQRADHRMATTAPSSAISYPYQSELSTHAGSSVSAISISAQQPKQPVFAARAQQVASGPAQSSQLPVIPSIQASGESAYIHATYQGGELHGSSAQPASRSQSMPVLGVQLRASQAYRAGGGTITVSNAIASGRPIITGETAAYAARAALQAARDQKQSTLSMGGGQYPKHQCHSPSSLLHLDELPRSNSSSSSSSSSSAMGQRGSFSHASAGVGVGALTGAGASAGSSTADLHAMPLARLQEAGGTAMAVQQQEQQQYYRQQGQRQTTSQEYARALGDSETLHGSALHGSAHGLLPRPGQRRRSAQQGGRSHKRRRAVEHVIQQVLQHAPAPAASAGSSSAVGAPLNRSGGGHIRATHAHAGHSLGDRRGQQHPAALYGTVGVHPAALYGTAEVHGGTPRAQAGVEPVGMQGVGGGLGQYEDGAARGRAAAGSAAATVDEAASAAAAAAVAAIQRGQKQGSGKPG